MSNMSNLLSFRPNMLLGKPKAFESLKRFTSNSSLRTGQITSTIKRKLSTPMLMRKLSTPKLMRKLSTPRLNRKSSGRQSASPAPEVSSEQATAEFEMVPQSVYHRLQVASEKRKRQNLLIQQNRISPPQVHCD